MHRRRSAKAVGVQAAKAIIAARVLVQASVLALRAESVCTPAMLWGRVSTCAQTCPPWTTPSASWPSQAPVNALSAVSKLSAAHSAA